jgi:hypothetical protein
MTAHIKPAFVTSPGLSKTQTYSWIIRNVFFDALARDPFFAAHTKRKTRMLVVQKQHLPYLGVYIVGDQMTPDGDANAGEPRLCHSLVIGYSVMIENNDPDAAEQTLDMALKRIQAVLCDPYIMNVWDTYNPQLSFGNPDNTRIESITRASRKHNWGSAGLNNETAWAELQYEETIFYRENFPPVIPDDLREIAVTTTFPGSDVTTQPYLERHYFFDSLEVTEDGDTAAFTGSVLVAGGTTAMEQSDTAAFKGTRA